MQKLSISSGILGQQLEFVIHEANVERRIMDDQVGTSDKLDKLLGHVRKKRFVGKKLVGNAVDLNSAYLRLHALD